jgi:Flp pilus assembly protein TadG
MRRWRADAGAAVVETAFVLPVFFALILGLVDLGLAVFQNSQASSAARDGARVAILSYAHADVTGSADRTTIEREIRRRLAGQNVDTVTVQCLDTNGATETCANADESADRVKVTVSWAFRPLGFLGAAAPHTISGASTMALVGKPSAAAGPVPIATTTTVPGATTTTTAPPSTTTTTAAASCAVSQVVLAPATTTVKANGTLASSVSVTVTTNGGAGCTFLNLSFLTDTTHTAMKALAKSGSTTWTATIGKNSYTWTRGTKSVNVQLSDGTPLASATMVLT